MKDAQGSLWRSVLFCLSISWKASVYYSVIRTIIVLILPIIPILLTLLSKRLLNILSGTIDTENPLAVLTGVVCSILLLTVLQELLDSWSSYSIQQHTELIQNEISLQQLQHALSMDLAYFDDPDCYDKLISSVTDYMSIAEEIWMLLSFISALIACVTTFLIVIRNNVLYAMIMLTVGVPSSVISAHYTKKLYHLSLEQIKGKRKLSILQSISLNRIYAQDLRLFQAGAEILRRYQEGWQALFQRKRNLQRKRSSLISGFQLLPYVAIFFIGFHLAVKVLDKQATIGDYSLYTGLLEQMWGGLLGLSTASMTLYENRLRFENLQSFVAYENKVQDGSLELTEPIQSLEFYHVSFRYTPHDPLVLNDISFIVNKRESLAIIGVNGSGKSTILKLLLRMYDPINGNIYINGRDIKKYTLASLRAQFSVYFQGMQNFYFTLRDNFVISDPLIAARVSGGQLKSEEMNLLDQQIRTALEESFAQDILRKAPKGLDQTLSRLFDSEGLELSVGQAQKLALARAFFRSHQVLVLDEPTSSIDAKAEYFIWEYIQQETEENIVILVTQKIYNLHFAKQIIFIEDGRICEKGTHTELLMKKGKYAALFNQQADNRNQL